MLQVKAMELKDMTLKDLEANIIVEYDFGHKTIPMRLIYPEVIKEWAIAKVKEFRTRRKNTEEELKKLRCPECGQPRPSSLCMTEDTTVYVEKWIIHNFNLTEKDLK